MVALMLLVGVAGPASASLDQPSMVCYSGTGKVGFGLPFTPNQTSWSLFYYRVNGGQWYTSSWYLVDPYGYNVWTGSRLETANQQGPLFQVGANSLVEGWELHYRWNGAEWAGSWVNLGSCRTDVDFTDTSNTYIYTYN
jgi:hypothetical protein